MEKVNLEQLKYLITGSMFALRNIKMRPGGFVMAVKVKGSLIQSLKLNPKYFNITDLPKPNTR
jgi:hypothetical protein